MANFTGMDIAEVRNLASQLDHAAEEIKHLTSQLSSKLHATSWVGHDRETFLNDWQSQHQARLNQVSEALNNAAQVARKNADEQEQVSNV